MALRKLQPGVPGQVAHHGDAGQPLDPFLHKPEVGGAGHAIHEAAGDLHAPVQPGVPPHEGRSRAGHGARVHHQEHGTAQDLGHLRAAAFFAHGVRPVVQAHHPFHDGPIARTARPHEKPRDIARRNEPAIEVPAGTPRGPAQVAGIDVVRAHLKRLDDPPGPPERPDDPDRHRGLASPAVRAGHQEPRRGSPAHRMSFISQSRARKTAPSESSEATYITRTASGIRFCLSGRRGSPIRGVLTAWPL